ncbi:MAG: DUF3347 domain-containing protein [Verrucomicrobia bacterium]|nr:DUF3347 domain-containing protein [Verrucomicrobiota bacterium]
MKNILTLSAIAAAFLGWAGMAHAQDTVLDNYTAVSTALAQDNLSAAKSAATTLAEGAKGTALAEHASALVKSDSLATAREHFKAISEEAVKLADGKAGYYVFTCPMVKAEWVQKTKEVQNPYMGKEMLGCGSIKSSSSASVKMGGCCG